MNESPVVVFERPPFSAHRFYYELKPEITWSSEVEALPQAWFDVLEPLIDLIDNARCADCQDAIGFVLAGDSDEYTEWRTVALVQASVDTPVRAVCEGCYPGEDAPAEAEIVRLLAPSGTDGTEAGT